jgi:hypothetical protein
MKYRKLELDEIIENGDLYHYPDGRVAVIGSRGDRWAGDTVATWADDIFSYIERPITKPSLIDLLRKYLNRRGTK